MDTTLETEIKKRIHQTLAKNLDLPLAMNARGISIKPDESRELNNYQPIWIVDKQVIIRANPDYIERIASCLAKTDLSETEIIASLKDVCSDVEQMMLYALIAEHFMPFVPDEKYTVRQLTQADQSAFAEFWAACPEDEREDAKISLEDECVFAVRHDEKIVAAASTFELWGFVDVGVLTHPDYRRQGLGKAAVAGIGEHYLSQKTDDRLLLYRHSTSNQGSSRIARGLNWQLFATTIYLKF